MHDSKKPDLFTLIPVAGYFLSVERAEILFDFVHQLFLLKGGLTGFK